MNRQRQRFFQQAARMKCGLTESDFRSIFFWRDAFFFEEPAPAASKNALVLPCSRVAARTAKPAADDFE